MNTLSFQKIVLAFSVLLFSTFSSGNLDGNGALDSAGVPEQKTDDLTPENVGRELLKLVSDLGASRTQVLEAIEVKKGEVETAHKKIQELHGKYSEGYGTEEAAVEVADTVREYAVGVATSFGKLRASMTAVASSAEREHIPVFRRLRRIVQVRFGGEELQSYLDRIAAVEHRFVKFVSVIEDCALRLDKLHVLFAVKADNVYVEIAIDLLEERVAAIEEFARLCELTVRDLTEMAESIPGVAKAAEHKATVTTEP